MCGIIGITRGPGPDGVEHEVLDVLVEGLERLEYRGYDSAGLALVGPAVDDGLWRVRAANGTRSLDDLAKRTEGAPAAPSAGIGHTRWATHGRPTEGNAHPHTDCHGRLALVHNGIIENHVELSDRLIADGHHLESETDTEVLAHLIESHLATRPGDGLAGAVRAALAEVGNYPCRINAQTYLADMYAQHGFVRDGDDFLDDGVPHVPMLRRGSGRPDRP